MLVANPAVTPISFLGSSYAFRGISEEQFLELQRTAAVHPPVPLGSTAEMISLFRANLPLDHVLEGKRAHASSLTLQVGSGIWYATGGGRQDGYLVAVPLPRYVNALREGGTQPIAYAGVDDGTEWIDPRFILPARRFGDWTTTLARALVDQEVLLVGGTVRPAKVWSVGREICDPQFAPWRVWGEPIARQLAGGVPPFAMHPSYAGVTLV